MNITIKKMETEEEIKGKAFVHWRSWHEAYAGIVSPEYLGKLTPEKCEELAYRWRENILVAKDGDRVVGFLGYGVPGEEDPDTGEVFALYILPEYYGTGTGLQLMKAGLEQLRDCPQVCVWVLKENGRAVRFYRKCGFVPDGTETEKPALAATAVRMVMKR